MKAVKFVIGAFLLLQVAADNVEDAQSEFNSFVQDARNRMASRVENISTILGDYVADFELDFYALFGNLIQPEISYLNHDQEVVTSEFFNQYIVEKAHELVDQYSNKVMKVTHKI
jgi:hypothetical protein